MAMPGRSKQSAGYRYGFNGQEKSDEIALGHTTAEYWEYDSRLGRRWNMDPVVNPNESQYACFGNNPILFNDPLGLYKTKFGAEMHKWYRGIEGTIMRAEDGAHKGEWFISQNYSYTSSDYDEETGEHTETMVMLNRRIFEDSDNNTLSRDERLSIHVGYDISQYSDGFKRMIEKNETYHIYGKRLQEDIAPIVEAEASVIFDLATWGGSATIRYPLKSALKKRAARALSSASKKAAKEGLTFNKGVLENFTKHAFAGGRHADLGLSVETMASKGLNLVQENMPLLKVGDNTLIGNINGVQKSFKAFVQDGKVMSVNMYPGVSNRATQGTVINFGNVTW